MTGRRSAPSPPRHHFATGQVQGKRGDDHAAKARKPAVCLAAHHPVTLSRNATEMESSGGLAGDKALPPRATDHFGI